VENILSHADMLNSKEEESRTALLKDVIHQHLSTHTRIWKTLLYRSGIILPSTRPDSIDAIYTYYDDDENNDYRITEAIRNAGALTGGINSETGQIHT
jgi:hypothetical protein